MQMLVVVPVCKFNDEALGIFDAHEVFQIHNPTFDG